MSRFDNIATADLVAQEPVDGFSYRELVDEVTKRLKAECPVQAGSIYLITAGQYEGRRMWVEQLFLTRVDGSRMMGWRAGPQAPLCVHAGGLLNGKSRMKDGWTVGQFHCDPALMTFVENPGGTRHQLRRLKAKVP